MASAGRRQVGRLVDTIGTLLGAGGDDGGSAQPEAPNRPLHCALLTRSEGLIEIILPDGVSLQVDAQVNVEALRRVLDALRGQ
jgi:hypothetical protein